MTGRDPAAESVKEAIRAELDRQAANDPRLRVKADGAALGVDGPVDLDALAMAVIGALAGGP